MLRAIVVALFTLPMLAQESKGVIEGRVLGPRGEPMPNIEVTATVDPYSAPILAKTRTDGDGMFVLARVPAQGCAVLARLPGHATARVYAGLSAELPAAGVHMRLWPANTLRGRVMDPAGKPLAGVSVCGTKDHAWFDGEFLAPQITTDDSGRFELPGVPIGDCVVRAFAPGFAMLERRLSAVADTTLDLVLRPGDETKITLTTHGLPQAAMPTAAVRIYPMRNGSGFLVPRAVERGVLDAQGRCQWLGLADAQWHVSVEASGFTFDPRTVTTEMGKRSHELTFRASADGSITLRGVLRDDAGKPLEGQTLVGRTQRSQSINGGRPGRAVTDAAGRFTLVAPLVEGEPYSLHLLGSTHVLAQTKDDSMRGRTDLRYGTSWEETADPARELALVAVRGARVTARLLDERGNPVPFQWTEVQGERANTKPAFGAVAYATSQRDGTVAFSRFHGGDTRLRVQASGAGGSGISETFTLAPGEQRDVVLQLQTPGRVGGRVLDGKGQPLAGVRVKIGNWVVETGKQVDGSWTNVMSDRDGRFLFTGVSAGGHRINTGRHEPAGKASSEIFHVAPGATVEIDLRIEK